jgi:fumarylacetoacetate (FAA) hydrolase
MKLATLRTPSPDGSLMLVNRALSWMVTARPIADRMIDALDNWERLQPVLQARAIALEEGRLDNVVPFDPSLLMAPLPRAYAWIDGTSYLSHMERARALRGATLPDDFKSEPLMTERVSVFLGARDPLPLADPAVGMDIEGEVGMILGDVPAGADEAQAAAAIRLVTLINDVSLRAVLAEKVRRDRPVTLAAKPYPSMGPVAVTPDELGTAWDGGLVKLRMRCAINGRTLAEPDGGLDASFTFPRLISYCAEYRPLPTGTVLAAGTLSNHDDNQGGACIAERRLIEQKRTGTPVTPYLAPGDELEIEMHDESGASVFGSIRQTVVAAAR